MTMILGLIGRNAAGKGEVAKFLESIGYQYYSLSDILREELKNRGQEESRENLIEIGNTLRRDYGPNVLAVKTIEKLEPDKNYVIDSIRNPREVEAFRKQNDFRLIKVTAGEEIRFERMQQRKRAGDPTTLDDFRRLEQAELESDDPAKQQLRATEEMADTAVSNDGSLDQLHQEIRTAVHELSGQIKRPGWDEYFMNIATMVALRSNCIKRKVAAILVKDKRIISTGYNGTPRGLKNCNEGGCPRCNSLGQSGKGLEDCYCSHAEENAITQASYHGVNIHGATLYTTFSPCLLCTKMIINSGITEVVFSTAYRLDDVPQGLLQEADIKIRQHTP